MSFTLLIRLAGPMQSWGINSRFGIRETLQEPSKSGVVGLLCAALGWDRAALSHSIAGRDRTLVDLAELSFGIRVMREGVVRRDYHTAQNVLRAKAKLKPGQPANPGDLQETVLSERYYLSDAFFLAGLESEDEPLLQALDAALAHPVWPLHLGRKAFVPSWPLRFAMADGSGIVNDCLAKALLEAEDPAWSDSVRTKSMTGVSGNRSVKPAFRFVMDASVRTQPSRAFLESSGYVPVLNVSYSDVPLSFHPRRFASREVTTFLHVPV